ncbi:Bis(5'-adenosyl)-triphosphatase [Astathelohania contejeani]|uniref:Bis(5'-adenosyl)-triphosphatase n=1 Tax=Astathelohania contejeani TaxID=164912 RepID=A0ABQ7HYV3_9MICR|nr:Bis(5'-adenosyl)-triphosphatase [Thelohania contejeani]
MNFGDITIPNEHIIVRSKLSFVFVNLRPFLPHHILVSPIRKIASITELTSEETADLFNTVRLCTIALQRFGDSCTISLQNGVNAGQTVLHVHVHVIPRKNGDLKNNDDIYKNGALGYIRTDRAFEDMEKERNFLKPFFDEVFDN